MATAFSRIKMPKVPSMGGIGGGVVNTAKHRQVLSLQQKITNEFRKQNKQVAKLNRGFSTMIDKGKAGMFRVTAPIVGVGALALAYEQLKTKLQIKGYFDNSIKKNNRALFFH